MSTFYGRVSEANYELYADGKTVNVLAVPESEGKKDKAVVLKTITVLKIGLEDYIYFKGIQVITVDNDEAPTKLMLSASLFFNSKV